MRISFSPIFMISFSQMCHLQNRAHLTLTNNQSLADRSRTNMDFGPSSMVQILWTIVCDAYELNSMCSLHQNTQSLRVRRTLLIADCRSFWRSGLEWISWTWRYLNFSAFVYFILSLCRRTQGLQVNIQL